MQLKLSSIRMHRRQVGVGIVFQQNEDGRMYIKSLVRAHMHTFPLTLLTLPPPLCGFCFVLFRGLLLAPLPPPLPPDPVGVACWSVDFLWPQAR